MATEVGDTTIATNAAGPRKGTFDGMTIEQHSLPDQIAADKYIEAKRATRRTTCSPIKFLQIIPPGAA